MACTKREKMARNSSMFWFPGLILCCFWFQTNSMEISMSGKSPVAFRSPLELKCVNRISDAGVYWFLQKKDYTTRFILYISTRSKITPEGIKDYQASKNGDYYQLTIHSLEEKHQGIYYCVSHRNQMLHFSSGLQVYVPERTTKPPPVTTQVSTRSKGQDMECQDHNSQEVIESSSFPCELYIWAPLAGGCFLLLILLFVTLSMCCDPRRRRRRCKCKRPVNGTNGIHPLPRKGT